MKMSGKTILITDIREERRCFLWFLGWGGWGERQRGGGMGGGIGGGWGGGG